MHYEQQQVGNTVVKLPTRPEAFNAEPIREPFERALKTKGKSTSAKGRVVGEDVKLAKASGKEENEHPRSGGRATIREWTPASSEAGVDTCPSTNRVFENCVCRKWAYFGFVDG